MASCFDRERTAALPSPINGYFSVNRFNSRTPQRAVEW